MHDDHDHPHDHHHGDSDHDPSHAPQADDLPAPRESRLLEQALRELLIDTGVLTAAMINAQIDRMDSRNPALGAKVIAHAWTDSAFKDRLIREPLGTIQHFTGMPMIAAGMPELSVVENDPDVHNVVVCTLCSCYPRMLLGIPPAWYKATDYRSRVVRDPRAVLSEFGLDLPETVSVRVHDSTADMRYLVIPRRPPETAGWTEEQLAAIVTRDCMIGAAVPKVGPGAA
jgi:nitrile hydratase alpha subunit